MKELNGREKIIVGLAAAAIIYGIYEYSAPFIRKFFPSEPVVGEINSSEDLRLFMQNVTLTFSKNALSEADLGIIEQGQKRWKRNPFREKIKKEVDPAKIQPEIPVIYSGYISMGKKRMAIINGMEYEVGDRLVSGDYVVLEITTDHAVISRPGKKARILPLLKDEY